MYPSGKLFVTYFKKMYLVYDQDVEMGNELAIRMRYLCQLHHPTTKSGVTIGSLVGLVMHL